MDIVYHHIDNGDARPIRRSPRRLLLAEQAEVNEMLKGLKKQGVIEKSDSLWHSPLVLIWKKNGVSSFCVD
jgi:hypothetical protein